MADDTDSVKKKCKLTGLNRNFNSYQSSWFTSKTELKFEIKYTIKKTEKTNKIK